MKAHEPLVHPQAAVAPGYLVNHAARAFNRLVDAQLRPHGLSMALLGPLLLLKWQGPMLQRDLVRASAVRQPAMVALLKKLEDQGLIDRIPTQEDRRASIVSLTGQGSALAELGGGVLIDANSTGLTGLSQAEAGQLVSLLQRLIGGLDVAVGTKHHE